MMRFTWEMARKDEYASKMCLESYIIFRYLLPLWQKKRWSYGDSEMWTTSFPKQISWSTLLIDLLANIVPVYITLTYLLDLWDTFAHKQMWNMYSKFE